ncbi:MAG: efflux RND transporter periplasmic adaptor subunit [Alphaproteobacteria bacterium]|nr:efflux RND transporter periplasmic adaptor subunit [Alphaproteobacteria bacterium]
MPRAVWIIGFAFAGFVLALLMLRAFDSEGPAEAPEREAIPVTVAEVGVAVDAQTIEATATLVLKRETALAFKVGGVIASLNVRAGDQVKAGQVLASLNQTEISAREREARAQLDLARKEYERAVELKSRGFVADRRVDDAKAALERAKAGFDVVHFDRGWAELKAPWDGVVLTRYVEAGELIAPGRPALAVGDTTGGFNLMTPIADRDVGRLVVGDRVDISFATTEQRVKGHVARVTAKADPRTGSFEAEIAVEDAPASLRSGMIGRAVIYPAAGAASTLVAIPAETIVEGDGKRVSVYVLKAGGKAAELREVRLARLEGSQALIASGLAPGERVVVSGAAYIRAGDPLKVVDSIAAMRPSSGP